MNFLQGLSRPLRLAGVVLIGVALVAVVIGGITALDSDSGNGQTAAPSPTTTGETSAPAETTASSPVEPPPSSPAEPPPGTETTVPGQEPTGTAAPGGPGTTGTQQPGGTPGQSDGGVPADQAAAKWVPVRVYNNSTIHGLAARAADELRANGWNIVEVGNYPYGVIPTTTAYYTPGTDEETAARSLATAFGMKVEPRFDGIQNSSPGVIVIVTNDYKGSQVKGS